MQGLKHPSVPRVTNGLVVEPPDAAAIRGLTFRTLDRAAVRASWTATDIALTTVVLGLVALLYVYFSFWIG